jgi:hypothetical protein
MGSVFKPPQHFINLFDKLADSWVSQPGNNKTIVHDCRIFGDPSRDGDDASRPLKVVVSSDKTYLAGLLNWLVFFLRICKDMSLLYLICYDVQSEAVMREHGLTCSKLVETHNRNRIWLYRTNVTRELLLNGYDVIVTDTDAIWMDNPIPIINQYNQSDFIASRGRFPSFTTEIYGSSFCMGFAYIKSNERTLQMYEDLVTHMERQKGPDDQNAINWWFKNNSLAYEQMPSMTDDSAEFGKLQHELNSRSAGMQVVSLPQRIARRDCEHVSESEMMETVVAHCLKPFQGGNSKDGQTKRMGLWAIKTDWKNISFDNHTIESFLMTISDKNAIKQIEVGQERVRRRRRRLHAGHAQEHGIGLHVHEGEHYI